MERSWKLAGTAAAAAAAAGVGAAAAAAAAAAALHAAPSLAHAHANTCAHLALFKKRVRGVQRVCLMTPDTQSLQASVSLLDLCVWCGVVWCGVVWCGLCLGISSLRANTHRAHCCHERVQGQGPLRHGWPQPLRAARVKWGERRACVDARAPCTPAPAAGSPPCLALLPYAPAARLLHLPQRAPERLGPGHCCCWFLPQTTLLLDGCTPAACC